MSRISRLAALNPLAMSVTWGAGGSTKERSLELAGLTQSQQWNTILHLTCTNMEQGLVDKVLKVCFQSYQPSLFLYLFSRRMPKKKGSVTFWLCEEVMHTKHSLDMFAYDSNFEDPPRGEEEWVASDSRFTRAVDLVSYIRSIPEYADWFCIGVAGWFRPYNLLQVTQILMNHAGYPDGHGDGLFDAATEMEHLKQKIDAGADFIITQLFYDVDHFLSWLSQIRQRGGYIGVIVSNILMQNLSRDKCSCYSGNHANTNLWIVRQSNKTLWNPRS